jgi:hypothetical protein
MPAEDYDLLGIIGCVMNAYTNARARALSHRPSGGRARGPTVAAASLDATRPAAARGRRVPPSCCH